jgi:hypothetical protein
MKYLLCDDWSPHRRRVHALGRIFVYALSMLLELSSISLNIHAFNNLILMFTWSLTHSLSVHAPTLLSFVAHCNPIIYWFEVNLSLSFDTWLVKWPFFTNNKRQINKLMLTLMFSTLLLPLSGHLKKKIVAPSV